MDLALNLIKQLEDYYNRKIVDVPLAAKAWLEVLAPLDKDTAMRLIQKIIEEEEWLPTVAKVRAEMIPSLKGQNFEAEIKRAIAAYATSNKQQIRALPEDVQEAIRSAGGVVRFLNATDQEFKKLKATYTNFRLQQQKLQPQLALGENHGNSNRILPAVSK